MENNQELSTIVSDRKMKDEFYFKDLVISKEKKKICSSKISETEEPTNE